MRRFRPLSFFVMVFAAVLMLCAPRAGARPPPETVTAVDLARYAGTWHEIAAIPAFFQRHCVAETTARYRLLPEGGMEVDNQCRNQQGGVEQSVGRARVVPDSGNARLEVSFLKLFGDWRYWLGGDYWVLALDDHYRWAVVGHPGRDYAWVLARETALNAFQKPLVLAALAARGYDACELLTTPQPGGETSRRPLCEIMQPVAAAPR